MAQDREAIRRKLALLPDRPGVYLMRNAEGAVIYVGKAQNLKNRVRSYFAKTVDRPKTARLVENIADFEYIVAPSEREALLLEANLIKEHMPHFNVMLKDDKAYPFIRITAEPFPRIEYTRRMVRDGSHYFGPYTDAGAVRRTLREIAWIFPMRSCTRSIPPEGGGYERACINLQLGKCLGPCVGAVSRGDYDALVRQVLRFLQGRDDELLDDLKRQMESAAEKLEFENAALARDRIAAIQRMMRSQNVYFADGRNRDVIGYYTEGERTAVTVLKILSGKLLHRETYDLDNTGEESAAQLMAAFVQQYYASRLDALPHRILLQEQPEDFALLNDWLGGRLRLPQRGGNRRLILIARDNAFHHVEERKLSHLRKTARTVFPVQELKDRLGLARLPRRMACFDISTIQGADTVASMVFFENGKPLKRGYRHFIMKTVAGQDDFASMAETLTRYLGDLDKHERADLLVIDGGKGQLGRAWQMLQHSGVGDMEMISLAKRVEEVFLPERAESVLLPRNSSALRLLVHIRDEAHRFAITFHRKRRSARTLASALDEIPGVGREKKFALLTALGSVQRIRAAAPQELAQVPGIGLKTARHILDWLHSHAPEADADDSRTDS